MKNGRMQAKDIPEGRLIILIKHFNDRDIYINTKSICAFWPWVPEKVLRAKLRILSERRNPAVLDGCACGCSSGWRVL